MKILEVVTEHTGPFKILFEVLKDMLTETNIEFKAAQKKESIISNMNPYSDSEPPSDSTTAGTCVTDSDQNDKKEPRKAEEKDCMKITAIDPTKTVLINLKLDGTNFSKFVCKKNKLLIGVNLGCFYKLIKSMGKNDILSLYVEHDTKNYLQIKIDSPDDKKDSKFKLKLMDLDENKMSIPEITFDAVITMDSQEFNKLCKEMNSIAEYVEIKCLQDKIIFTCKGETAERTTTYTNDISNHSLATISHGCTKSESTPQIIQGIFELKNLVLFSKCSALCDYIEIYMKNDFPLVIRYTVATLGRILLCLTPIKEDTKQSAYSDEEEFYSDQDATDSPVG